MAAVLEDRLDLTIQQVGPAFVWDQGVFGHFPIVLDQPPAEELMNRVVGAVGKGAKKASVVEVKYSQVMPPRDTWWRGSTREVLKHVARLWGFGVQLESVNAQGDVSRHWTVPGPAQP